MVLVLAGCGYIGDPLPPALNTPSQVTGLTAVQRADRILVEFTIPALTTEGLPLRLGSVDLRAGVWENGPFDPETWAEQARRLDTTRLSEPGRGLVEAPARPWVGHEVFLRARAVSDRERAGEWSEFAILRVVEPLDRPSGLRADGVPEGVRLTWEGPREPPDLRFRIFRRTEGQEAAALIATAVGREWVDTTTQYGVQYEYAVQAILSAGASEAESEMSASVGFKPEDRFPPAVPSGLAAVPGADSVELVWERNIEPDLLGYRVYRSEEDQPFRRIADLVIAPSYSDRNVRAGVRYGYAVSSVDLLGNESESSNPVEITP